MSAWRGPGPAGRVRRAGLGGRARRSVHFACTAHNKTTLNGETDCSVRSKGERAGRARYFKAEGKKAPTIRGVDPPLSIYIGVFSHHLPRSSPPNALDYFFLQPLPNRKFQRRPPAPHHKPRSRGCTPERPRSQARSPLPSSVAEEPEKNILAPNRECSGVEVVRFSTPPGSSRRSPGTLGGFSSSTLARGFAHSRGGKPDTGRYCTGVCFWLSRATIGTPPPLTPPYRSRAWG